MKTQFILGSLLMGYVMTHTLLAGEHPKEHPKEAETETNANAIPAPTEAEAPNNEDNREKVESPTKKTNKKSKKGDNSSWNKTQVEKDLIAFINNEKNKNSGIFIVKDNVTAANRKLTLEKIHTDKIVRISDGVSFVCADFQDANGQKLDVDFFMTPTAAGALAHINKIQVHKVNGAPRYSYVERNGKWIQETVVN